MNNPLTTAYRINQQKGIKEKWGNREF